VFFASAQTLIGCVLPHSSRQTATLVNCAPKNNKAPPALTVVPVALDEAFEGRAEAFRLQNDAGECMLMSGKWGECTFANSLMSFEPRANKNGKDIGIRIKPVAKEGASCLSVNNK
jgi:hypothetical protein